MVKSTIITQYNDVSYGFWIKMRISTKKKKKDPTEYAQCI